MNKDKMPVRHLPDDAPPLTVELLQAVMPKRQKHNITQGFVDTMNKLALEPEVRHQFRENFIGYTSVLKDPNSTLPGYISAVKYISYKLMGYTNQESWIKVFPERFQRMIDDGREDKYIRSVVAAYNRGKMLNQIREQAMIPSHVINQDIYQDAVNTQHSIMHDSRASYKVRSDAANSLLMQLRQPESTKLTLDVKVEEDESIKQLREAMLALAKEQRSKIQAGASTARDVAESQIINGEAVRID